MGKSAGVLAARAEALTHQADTVAEDEAVGAEQEPFLDDEPPLSPGGADDEEGDAGW